MYAKLPLRLDDNNLIDANEKRVCALFDWYDENGALVSIPHEEVRAVGEWMVKTLNATATPDNSGAEARLDDFDWERQS